MALKFKFKVNEKVAQDKLNMIGKAVSMKMQTALRAAVGTTKLTQEIKYKVEDNRVIIYTENKILTYIEKGTKPHIIRPKNKKALAWQKGTGAGSLKGFGDMVFAKEVHHPGTDPRPFFSSGFFASKPLIQKILGNK